MTKGALLWTLFKTVEYITDNFIVMYCYGVFWRERASEKEREGFAVMKTHLCGPSL